MLFRSTLSPPSAEASGYIMSAEIVHFLLQESLQWRGTEWATEDETIITYFGGARERWGLRPNEIKRAKRVLGRVCRYGIAMASKRNLKRVEKGESGRGKVKRGMGKVVCGKG